jgi:hypothetical protein
VYYRELIGDGAGEVIVGDDLIEEVKLGEESEVTKNLEKQMRYKVHRSSVVSQQDRGASFEVRDTSSFIGKLRGATFTDGFVRRGGPIMPASNYSTK